jgi:thymidylate kinase
MRRGYYRIIKSQRAEKVFDPKLLGCNFCKLWGFIEFVSIMPWVLKRMFLPIWFGFTVVADRFVLDTVVYGEFWVGESFKGLWGRLLSNMMPKRRLLVFLDADTEVLVKRKQSEALDRSFLEFQRRTYKVFAKRLNALVIDTIERDIMGTFNEITDALYSKNERVNLRAEAD